MTRRNATVGAQEVRSVAWASRGALMAVAVFSMVVNLLMLTGPLYMMQVYDRVLTARSEETLVALSLLAVALFAVMGWLDVLRVRIMARVGARFQDALDLRVFRAALRRSARAPDDVPARMSQSDLEAVQRCLASPIVPALFDLPWTPVFAGLIFLFHPALGVLALVSGAVLIAMTLLNRHLSHRPLTQAGRAGAEAEGMAHALRAEGETVRALGMTGAAFRRWSVARRQGLVHALSGAERTGAFSSATRTLRLMMQSAMLGLGAWLVLEQAVGAGVMIASSILLGRALAPVETVIGQWTLVVRAREGADRLATLLTEVPAEADPLPLPRPAAHLRVEGITLTPPGASQPTLRDLSFTLAPGQALGVIGASGAGKSSLARALVGLWAPQAGQVRLDGATLDQYAPDTLGGHVGYLPQRVALFDGTVAENIARLAEPEADAVIAAARAAAAHEMILRLPQGYDTRLSANGGRLSGGQIQRIGLARALYRDPVLLVLDEPNANLDAEGTEALNAAVRAAKARGCAVVVIAHRPAAIQDCDLLMVMEDGASRAFGPRADILRRMVRNHTEIVRAAEEVA
ncbi:type I secretion system permease/ATPase [Falsirhodobacter halotolerans]|uniref:type I secretion system permease/ATPase n=1 Tax=Falsirhodobacter halotolerans TaxID=1146892 RepID=UPI001FD19610|nr:type I secretion system permease/ATPase [Falsirhodobacter halotolerans]MCJ8140666.1 type I secretion system permease/ATPase [Falsirhodobacter halotolerans]